MHLRFAAEPGYTQLGNHHHNHHHTGQAFSEQLCSGSELDEGHHQATIDASGPRGCNEGDDGDTRLGTSGLEAKQSTEDSAISSPHSEAPNSANSNSGHYPDTDIQAKVRISLSKLSVRAWLASLISP